MLICVPLGGEGRWGWAGVWPQLPVFPGWTSEVAEEFVFLAPVHLGGPLVAALLVGPLFGHGQGDIEIRDGIRGGGGGRRGWDRVLSLGAVLGIQL